MENDMSRQAKIKVWLWVLNDIIPHKSIIEKFIVLILYTIICYIMR